MSEGSVRKRTAEGVVKWKHWEDRFIVLGPHCPCCGNKMTLRGKLICRKCGYFESCCDGGKEAMKGECDE